MRLIVLTLAVVFLVSCAEFQEVIDGFGGGEPRVSEQPEVPEPETYEEEEPEETEPLCVCH